MAFLDLQSRVDEWIEHWTSHYNAPEPTEHEKFLLIMFASWLSFVLWTEGYRKDKNG